MCNLLLISDEDRTRGALAEDLGKHGWHVTEAADLAEARLRIQVEPVQVILGDAVLADGCASDLFRMARSNLPEVTVVVMSSELQIGYAIEALELGIQDFLIKPFPTAELNDTLARTRSREALPGASEWGAVHVPDLQGTHPGLVRALKILQRVSCTDQPLLLMGEPGTGKRRAALGVHRAGWRASGRFVVLDCADDASVAQSAAARFQESHGGTLVLENVERLQTDQQAEIVELVRANKAASAGLSSPVGVRLVGSTCVDLEDEVDEGRFREDLLRCFHAITVRLPPLRGRAADIAQLVDRLVESSQSDGVAGTLAPEALDVLCRYDWPGNVRELESAISEMLARPCARFGLAELPVSSHPGLALLMGQL